MMTTMPGTSPSQDVARRLTDDGYVVVTGMMTPDGVQNARADLDRVLRTTRTGRNSFEGFGTQRIYALFAKTRAFDAYATDPLLLGVLDQVLGHYQLSAPVGICIGPGEKAQVLHRDDARDLALDLIAVYEGSALLANARRQPDLLSRAAGRLDRWIDTM